MSRKISEKKLFRILLVCVALIVTTIGLTSIALAKKPQPSTTAYNGFVEFSERVGWSGNMWRDGVITPPYEYAYKGERIDPYDDYSILLTIEDISGTLVEAKFVCGWPPNSIIGNYDRRVGMNLAEGGPTLTQAESLGSVEQVFFDEFCDQDFSAIPLIGHLQGKVRKSGESSEAIYADLISDGIRQSSLTDSSAGPGLTDADLERYRFSNYSGLLDPHLIYGLSYENCEVSQPDEEGKWTVTFGGDNTPVQLFVYRLPRKGNKPLPSNPRPEDYTEHVILGTYYGGLPFAYKTWHAPEEPNEPKPQYAPGKYRMLSVLWGDIKSRL